MKPVVLALFLLCPCAALARHHNPPPAPLPSQITQAKTVFLVNGGGSDIGYDAFYQAMKSWGKYRIVGSPSQADLILTYQYFVEKDGSSSYPVTNLYTGKTLYYSSENRDPQITLTITDPSSHTLLWSELEHRKLVASWHVNKEIEKTSIRIVTNLEARAK